MGATIKPVTCQGCACGVPRTGFPGDMVHWEETGLGDPHYWYTYPCTDECAECAELEGQ